MFKQFARWGLVLSKAALSRLHVLLSSFPFTLHNTTKLWHCSSHLLYFTFLLLWLSIQRQKTDNSGAYGGQEVMQINVSQSLYILALQSPCREELWGQLSIIGPQMISKEDFMPERERGGGCWRCTRNERAGDSNKKRRESDKTESVKGSAAVSRHTCCIFMTSDAFASLALCFLSTLSCSSQRVLVLFSQMSSKHLHTV